MKRVSNLLKLTIILFIVFTQYIPINGMAANIVKKVENTEVNNAYQTHIENFVFNNEVYEMLKEFINPNDAIQRFVIDHYSVFELLKNDINIPFNLANIGNFRDALLNYNFSNGIQNEIQTIVEFIDIAENTIYNNEIREYINNGSINENINTIIINLPYTEAVKLQINNSILFKTSRSILAVRNISAGVSYAQTYAIYNNSINKYYNFGGTDCTNFTSQILEAMGVVQVTSPTDDVNVGWWHKVKTYLNPYTYQNEYTHTHSASFIRVSSFILKFGLYASYTDFKIFSQNVKVGDIIILDSNNDNSWDHVGFVTAISTTLGTYTDEDGKSRSYYNFKVAQHSNNYHLQVNDNNNDWEKSSGTGRFAILARS